MIHAMTPRELAFRCTYHLTDPADPTGSKPVICLATVEYVTPLKAWVPTAFDTS